MFDSIVTVLPTLHEGGALHLRHGGKEWIYDSATQLAQSDGPNIGFVALYSDVEHEVSLVESGHRVTITYNLDFTDVEALLANGRAHERIESTFLELLDDLHTLLSIKTYIPDIYDAP